MENTGFGLDLVEAQLILENVLLEGSLLRPKKFSMGQSTKFASCRPESGSFINEFEETHYQPATACHLRCCIDLPTSRLVFQIVADTLILLC